MAEDATLTLGADGSAYTKTLKEIEKHTDTMANSITARLARIGQAFQGIGAIGGTIKSVCGTLWDMGKAVVKPAAAAETTALKFEVMLNSEEETLRFMERLNAYAEETPFFLEQISDAALVMLANTDMSANSVMDMLQAIGNISAMTGKGLKDIADLYARAANMGVTTQIAKSFETMGVPIRKVIAEIQGITFEEVNEKISAGLITIDHLDAALKSLTSNGGKFDGATKRLSQTFEGLASTVEGKVNAALTKFGEQILPAIKPILEKIIEALTEAMPAIERLGIMFGDWLTDKVNNGVLPAMDDMILAIPEVVIQIEYLAEKTQEFMDTLTALPDALSWPWEKYKEFAHTLADYMTYENMSWSQARKHAQRVMRNNTADGRKDNRLKEARRRQQLLKEEAEERRKQRLQEAHDRDQARADERAAMTEKKKASDESARAAMAEAEARKKAAADAKKLAEDNAKAAEKYAEDKARYEVEVEKRKREKLSLMGQRRALEKEGSRLGVQGALSPESIRRRMDALAAAGAETNKQELAALSRLLEAWDALVEKKRDYATSRRQDQMEIRAGYLESIGQKRKAAQLREQLEVEKRIKELRESGATKRDAKRQALVESQIRQAQQLQEKIQNARVEFIQTSQAAEGGGGISYRLSNSTLEESKKHSTLLRDIRNYMRTMATTQNSRAVLA